MAAPKSQKKELCDSVIANQVVNAPRKCRWDLEVKPGAVFRYGSTKYHCVYDEKKDQYDIEKVDEYDQQQFIKFENVDPSPPLKSGDIIMYGEDNWFCCYGAERIVPMLKYDRMYRKHSKGTKAFQFLIG